MYTVKSTLRHNGVEYPVNSQMEETELSQEQANELMNAGVIAVVVVPQPVKAAKPAKVGKKAKEEVKEETTAPQVNESASGEQKEMSEEEAQQTAEDKPSIKWSIEQLKSYAEAHGVEVSEVDSKSKIMAKLSEVK